MGKKSDKSAKASASKPEGALDPAGTNGIFAR